MTRRALADFNKAIELNPGYAAAYYNRARIFGHRKEYDSVGTFRTPSHKEKGLAIFMANPLFLVAER